MNFDREAIRGIYDVLSLDDQAKINRAFHKAGGDMYSMNERIELLTQVMIRLGHIVPFHVSSGEVAAQEYEEIMIMQEMMER